jgi:hypothetical protein
MHQTGSLKMRVNAMLTPDLLNIEKFVENGPFQKERLTVNSINSMLMAHWDQEAHYCWNHTVMTPEITASECHPRIIFVKF